MGNQTQFMKVSTKAIVTHALVLLFFMGAALTYFYPVIQGKGIYQSDIAQYKGMAQERDSYKATSGIESYWTNSAFGGMPTYQLGANYPHDYIKKLDRLLRFLPRPADYLFLYFLQINGMLLEKVVVVGYSHSSETPKGVNDDLKSEAVEAVGKLGKFIPAQKDNKPVSSVLVLPIEFKLE